MKTDAGVASRQPGPSAASPGRSDVRQFYLLALGRPPETPDAETAFLGQDFKRLAAAFFRCEEFERRVIPPLEAGRRLAEGPAVLAPSLRDWAARRLPLSAAGRKAAAGARSLAGLYAALFGDARFRQVLGENAPVLGPHVIDALRSQADLQASLDEASATHVTGWAFRQGGDGPLTVEVRANGRFVLAGRADLFRRDVQDRFGGDGHVGFNLVLPMDHDDGHRRLTLEVRESGTGVVLGEGEVARSERALDAFGGLRAELTQIRRLLEHLDERLPAIEREMSMPLSAYGNYHERWYAQELPRPETEGSLSVWIDGMTAPAPWIEDSVWSVCGQAGGAAQVILSVGPEQATAARDLANRVLWRDGATRLRVEVDEDPSPATRLRRGLAGLPSAAQGVLLMDAAAVLAPDALARFAGRFHADPACEAIYADEDAFAPIDADRAVSARRRHDPMLRPGFDPDLLMQTPYVGGVIAFRRETLDRVGTREGAGALHAADALLRLQGEAGAVAHLARVLATRNVRAGPVDQTWVGCIAAYLAESAEVEGAPRAAVVAGALAGAARVRVPVPEGCRATVVVPTRDSLDLLKGCIDSLLLNRPANRAIMEILVVDHASQEPETRTWLAEREQAGDLRVMPFEGPFNWALINNLAAEETDAEVLVFLNNDTVVDTPDWLDELVGQALRPQIGVVGCRLLYADGTTQHAGFVARDSEAAFLVHEGVGQPGSDPGYLGRHVLSRQAVAVTGACMAVRAEVFRALGGFDAANFPVEGNDVDLCLRARAAGLKVLYDPYASLYHMESKTRGFSFDGERKTVAEAASRLLWRRWGARFGRDPFYNAHFDRLSRPFTRLRPPPDSERG